MRKIPLIKNEYYHVYNRGVDKRNIFGTKGDSNRFLQSMDSFNTEEPVGSLYQLSFDKRFGRRTSKSSKKLVEIVCFCLNLNHFHFLLKQVAENGISEFMKRLSGGYTKYFNEKNERSGVLFQGKFKSSHIDSNEYMLHLSVYINLNNLIHGLSGEEFKNLSFSSWKEYIEENMESSMCAKQVILDQFKSREEYKDFAEKSLPDIIARKTQEKEIEEMFID